MPPSRPSKNRETDQPRVLANRYEVVKKLGTGNFGTAFLCKDRRCKGELKCLKEIPIGDLQLDETVDAMHEAKLLSKLDHPGIVKFHDQFVDGEFFCIITEYCEGGDLDMKIQEFKKKKKKFDETTVMNWFVQLVLAVQYMHSRRVLHRDLKTRNIFLKNNVVKIGDFGISRILMGTTDFASTFVGTPYFMSPEVLKHEGYNSKSDVWSVGCILYEICALDHAFNGQSLMGVMYKIVEGELPSLPSNYPRELDQVFKMMLAKDQTDRPSMTELTKNSFVAKHMSTMLSQLSDFKTKPELGGEAEIAAEELEQLLREKSHLGDLRATEADVKYKNLHPRERMRLRKQREADAKAQEMKEAARANLAETYARREKLRSTIGHTNLPPIVDGLPDGFRSLHIKKLYGTSLGRGGRSCVGKPYGQAWVPTQIFLRPKTAPRNSRYEDMSEEDDFSDTVKGDIDIHRTLGATVLHVPKHTYEDRPITPLKDKMVYNTVQSSLDFEDGIPDHPELAETYYSQFEDFEKADGKEENEDKTDDAAENTLVNMDEAKDVENLLSCLEGALDRPVPEGSLTLSDDTMAGAFGPGAREIKIRNLRSECERILGKAKFEKAYTYLKNARFQDKATSHTADETMIFKGLREIVPNPSDCFLVDQLLFLEEQAKLQV
ncbi:serine/threonine-protein kinase Nek11-like [Liolophura sinensis]|uniref:serine/threonine-protein kinase Nek11-like n=1 Tax=Liolophura sinensis TaxID=3198878 RepID=UPI0031581015